MREILSPHGLAVLFNLPQFVKDLTETVDLPVDANIIMSESYCIGSNDMKTVSLKLTEGMDQKLAGAARKRGTTKSNIMRLALQTFLGDDPAGQAGSCLDLAGDVIGSVDACPDLSVNPIYLKRFGK